MRAKNLGVKLGIIFQMDDGNLDFSNHSGKAYAKDLQEGLLNFTALELMQLYPQLIFPLYQIRGRAVPSFPWSELQIQAAKSSVKKKIHNLSIEILKQIEEFHSTLTSIDPLITSQIKSFITRLMQRDQ